MLRMNGKQHFWIYDLDNFKQILTFGMFQKRHLFANSYFDYGFEASRKRLKSLPIIEYRIALTNITANMNGVHAPNSGTMRSPMISIFLLPDSNCSQISFKE